MLKVISVQVIFFILKNSNADDTVSWDCPPGDTSCDIQRDDPNLLNCGKFQKYNPSTVRTHPATKGVLGGFDFDGTPQYVGYGPNNCGNPTQRPCPGAIYVVKKNITTLWCFSYWCFDVNEIVEPGIHMACDSKRKYKNDSIYFLLNHTDYQWVDTNVTHMLTLKTALRLPGLYWTFMYGRIWYKGNWRFGKVHVDKRPDLGIHFQDEDYSKVTFEEGFQVLTCSQCLNGGTGQYCCKNGANNPDCCLNGGYGKKCTLPCGHQLLLSEENNPDNPKTPGFNSGLYEDGSTVYPGIGYFPDTGSIDVARIQTSNYFKGPGAYNSWLDTYHCDKARPKYLLAHPNLKWVRTNVSYARYVPGVIRNFLRFGDLTSSDYYARVNYTNANGTFQNIGYYWREEVCAWNGKIDDCTKNDFDILACAP